MPSPAPRLVVSSFDPRADLAVQALAQGPSRAELELTGDRDRPDLDLLIRVHGRQDRVRRVPGDPTMPLGIDPERFAGAVEALFGPDDPAAPIGADDAWLAGERILIVTNHPAHYRIPLFNRMAERVQAAGGAFRVLFQSAGYARRAWMRPAPMTFDHRVLRVIGIRLSTARHPFVPLNLAAEVRRFRPSIIASGGFSPVVSGRLARQALRAGIPFGLWSGETPATARTRAAGRREARSGLAERATFGLAYGALSREYLRELNPGLPVAIVRNTTVPPVASGAPLEPGAGPHLLTVADLSTPGKGIETLIRALAEITDRPWTLTVAGGGRGLAALRAEAEALGGRVRFTGAVPSNRIGGLFAGADVYAFPSRVDVFGLVLVEAMAHGLPVLTGRRPGAVADLCHHDGNAMVIEDDSPEAWRDALAHLLDDAALRERIGAAGRRTIERRWTIEHSADAFLAGLRLGRLTGP
ncbi:MAG: glycosyltransferase family 4 protein [Actinomycetota bacterium]